MNGPIALVGGGEFLPDTNSIDAYLLGVAKGSVVTIVPTAAANERPDKAVETARKHFEELGATVKAVMILDDSDAKSPKLSEALVSSSFIYLVGGDPNHLMRVLENSPAWDAICESHQRGGVIAGSSAGAMVLGDEMLVSGSDTPVAALGLIPGILLVPHYSTWGHRIVQISDVMSKSKRILALDDTTGVVIESGRCSVLGTGNAFFYKGKREIWHVQAPGEVDECLV